MPDKKESAEVRNLKLLGFEVKRKIHNKCDFDKKTLIGFGTDELGMKSFCPKCYENNKSQIPVGEKVIKYNHLFTNLVKYHYRVVNKTVYHYYKCNVCDFKKVQIDTYRSSIKRISIQNLKQLLKREMKNRFEILKPSSKKGEYRYCTDIFFAHYEGEIRAYKRILDLLEGRDV